LPDAELTRVRTALARALSVDDVDQIGRDTGQSKRLRTVTPHRLFLSIVASLAGAKTESIADLLREFNHQNHVTVAYKAFYNRLARPGFARFMQVMFARLVERLSIQTLEPDGHTAIARFKDIVIQDGSSFALKKALRDVFPGRFTTVEPAAIELHATYSGFSDEVSRLQIAADKEAERQFLPDPSTLKDRLLLADRGYPDVEYFEAVEKAGGAFIVRLTRSHDPWVRAAWVDGKCVQLPDPIRLSTFVAQNAQRRMDLDVEYKRGKRMVRFRVVVLPGREKTMTRLCTNLPRTPFSIGLISRLYQLPLAGRAPVQGVEVLREPAQVRHRQPARRGRPHLGQSLLRSPQTVPRSRGSARRRQAHLHSTCRDVRAAHHRRDLQRPPRVPQHRGRVPRRPHVLARQRASIKSRTRSQDGPASRRVDGRRGTVPKVITYVGRLQRLLHRSRGLPLGGRLQPAPDRRRYFPVAPSV